MSKLTKRVVEAFAHNGRGDSTMLWDEQLKGFGIRAFASGTKKFVVQYRTRSGKQRRMTLGAYGPLTVERARELAKMHLGKVAEGEDPGDRRAAERAAITVATLCDLYMEAANAGLVIGRKGTPKKRSTLDTDKGRVERHIKPLLGVQKASAVQQPDIEAFKNSVAAGRTATDVRTGLRGRAIVRGGRGTASRTLGLLGAIYQWGISQGLVDHNPVRGVRRFADKQRKALLSKEQYNILGSVLRELDAEEDRHGQPRHNPQGLACIRLIALTGLRRGEAVNLRWSEVDFDNRTLVLGDTKTGENVRPLGLPAVELLKGLGQVGDYVFPSEVPGKPYGAVPKFWRLVRERGGQDGGLQNVTLHSLRHSYAGVAEESGASLPTIAALLGHRLGGVTAGYVLKRVDRHLIAIADKVSFQVKAMMDGATDSKIVKLPAA